jgi:hypothetical protein
VTQPLVIPALLPVVNQPSTVLTLNRLFQASRTLISTLNKPHEFRTAIMSSQQSLAALFNATTVSDQMKTDPIDYVWVFKVHV